MHKQNTIRLFTGTYVDDELFRYIYNDIKDDFAGATFGKWVEPDNLHFTYHFIGDIPIDKLDELKKNLSEITVKYNSVLEFHGISVFPNRKKPRVLHIPVINDGILTDIYEELRVALNEFSIETEHRKFAPHLTLQRIKDFSREQFGDVIEKYRNYDFGIMSNFKVSLIQSTLTPKGPVYRIIQ